MGRAETLTGITLEASDVSGQKVINVPNIPHDSTVGELIPDLIARLNLPDNVPYEVRLEREGRHLNASERVSDALQSGDVVVLQPSIDAGGGS